MKLSSLYLENSNFEIIREGTFNTCGFLHQGKKNILSFLSSKKYMNQLKNKNVSSIICTEDIIEMVIETRDDIGIIVYKNPRELIFKISDIVIPKKFKSIISSNSTISERAIISENNVCIGSNCVIEDNVIIKRNVIIRDNVHIGAGTILGCEGLMVYDSNNEKKIAKHNGYLYVDSNTKVLNNCLIEKAVFNGDITYIGKNIVLDSGVSISHGCNVRSNTIIAAGTKICGYTKIGANSYIGPGVVISNNLSLGENCNIRIGSIVIENLGKNSDVSSSFAMDHRVNLINRFAIVKHFKNIGGRK